MGNGVITKSKYKFDQQYMLGRTLGSGAFSTVLLGINKMTGANVAVKVKEKEGMSEKDIAELIYELEILSLLDHPNIIKLYETFDEPNKIYIVSELVEGGELFDRIVAKEKYSEKEARDIMRTLLETMSFVHDRGFVHRDLKPENILMCSDEDDTALKIADFGFAKRISELKDGEVPLGTPGYAAPEVYRGYKYDCQPDIWSLGVICYVLLVGYPPFYDDNQKRLEAKIKAGKYHFHEEYWHNKSPDAIDLIRKMMTVDHRKRWTAKQLLQHPWILEDSKILAQKSIIETIDTMKKFNAKRKFRAVVRSIIMIERVAKITGVKQRMSLNGRSSNAGDVPALTAAVAALDTNSPRPSDAGADSPRKSIDPATLTARVPEFVGQDLSELTESQKTARKERQSGTEMSPTSPRKSGAATSVSETQKSAVEALESTPDCSPQIDTHKSPIAPSTVVQ